MLSVELGAEDVPPIGFMRGASRLQIVAFSLLQVKMRLKLPLCFMSILMGCIDPVDSPVPPAEKHTYHHPNNISFQLICPEAQVEAVAGHPVTLKCYTKPELKVERVEWLVNDSTEVHVFRGGKDHNEHQNENYKGKTALFKDELYRGNSSLNLTAEMYHSGNYCCFVYASKVDGKCYITVNVHPEGENNSSHALQEVTVSPDNPNSGTDGLTTTEKVGLGVGIPAALLLIVIITLVYYYRERLKQLCSREPNNPPIYLEVPDQAQQPPQNEENEPVDPNPNEERNQMIGDEDQGDPADGN